MATVEPKSLYAVSPAEPQMTYFQVAIAQGAFADSADANGGRVSPCVAHDFATKPTTLAESTKVSRGAVRFKLMMNSLGIRSNFKIHNIVTTYASDAGDNPITNLAFGLVFESPDFIPTTGTSIDGSSTGSKAEYIADKIGEALNTTHTENANVYDPTETSGVVDQELRNISLTVGPVSSNTGTIRDAISVTEVSAFAPNTSGQLATDNALTYSAE